MKIFKPKSHIAFDIDGIVLDTASLLWDVITTHLGVSLPISKWTNYAIENTLNINKMEIRPIYEPVLRRNDIPIIYGADDILKWFHKETQEPILFITARRPQFLESARQSISRVLNGTSIEIVGCSSETSVTEDPDHSKIHYLLEREINFFIEDNPKHWLLYMDNGIRIGTFVLPWNREYIREILDPRGKYYTDYGKKGMLKAFHGWYELGMYLKSHEAYL